MRGSSIPDISRETFAVFMEPMWDCDMVAPHGVDPQQTQSQSAAMNLPPGVPTLSKRWVAMAAHEVGGERKAQSFGEFSEATHKSYY